MKCLLVILVSCITTLGYSQAKTDLEYFFHGIKGNDDNSYRYYIAYLNKFDSTNPDQNFLCNYAAERIGDYYESKGDYLRAIAYYDSTEIKYRDRFPTDSKLSYYESLISTRNKTSKCYPALHNPKKALSTLAPIMFSICDPPPNYMDSAMMDYYIGIVYSLYSKREVCKELESSFKSLTYSATYKWARDSSYQTLDIVSKVRIFDTEFKLVRRSLVVGKSFDTVPSAWTKEGVLKLYSDLPITKQLEN